MVASIPRQLNARQKKFVAFYLGDANGNATEAARLAGYEGDAKTLSVTGFKQVRNAKIAAAIAEEHGKLERRGVAVKQARIDAKLERWQALNAIRLARATAFAERIEADAALPDYRRRPVPPGWETGFHVTQSRAIPIGRGQVEVVEEFVLDTAMLREFDALEKDIATELGEVPRGKLDVRYSGHVRHDHTHRLPDFSLLSPQEQFALDQMMAKLEAGGGEWSP
jgi:hypothetical protein